MTKHITVQKINNNMEKIKNKNAFTLIELIVSITIIALLTVVGIVSYGPFNKKSRDSRRMTDLENIRLSLELYRNQTGYTYPVSLDTIKDAKYLSTIPLDPKTKAAYLYTKIDGYNYKIETILEETGIGYSVTNP